jgi:xanthine dehydrogenase molybdopterin-binding subunit B
VPGSQGLRHDFRISVGLRKGWDAEGRVFDVSEAVGTACVWMKRRVEAGRPAPSGMFTRAEVTYAWPRADGTVGSDRELVALFTGKAVHAYLGHLSDAAIEEMLNELATELGAALGQERIYVAFADRTWILDAGEHGG